jgi:3-deoxy-D-manno-octulosonic-acid transferase
VLAVPFYLWKGRATGHYWRTFRARMGRLPPGLDGRRDGSIWIHAVSVGEALAARSLVEPLERALPGRTVFVSTSTAAGGAVAAQGLPAERLFVAPFDFPWAVGAVLRDLRPSLLVLVETELWPNLIRQARRRGIPIAVVNGRISDRSFPRYLRIRALLRHVLAQVDLFLMQGETHADRIRALGAPPGRVRVSGNLKFDALTEPRPPAELSALASGAGALWVAGSTMAGEDELVLHALREVRAVRPDARLVLAPRRPERFADVPALAQAAGFLCVKRSALGGAPWREGEVLLLDTMGELAGVYALATVVFVGGSLVPTGGHNVLEAAICGKAVVVGPHMENFHEIAALFRGEGALVQIDSAERLGPETLALLQDDERRELIGRRARALVDRNRGARVRTVDALAGLVA